MLRKRVPVVLHFCLAVSAFTLPTAAQQPRYMLGMCLWSSGHGGSSQIFITDLTTGNVKNRRASWQPEFILSASKNSSDSRNRTLKSELIRISGSQNDNIDQQRQRRESPKTDVKKACINHQCRPLKAARIEEREPRSHISWRKEPSNEHSPKYERDAKDCFGFGAQGDLKFHESQSKIPKKGLRSYFPTQDFAEDTHNLQTNFTHNDGLVLRVLHEVSGATLVEKVFPTWELFAFGAHLGWWLDKLQPGRIASVIVRKQGIFGIWSVQNTLRKIGSVFVDTVPIGDMWIWVWIVQGKTLLEATSNMKNNLFAHNQLNLIENNVNVKKVPNSNESIYLSNISKINVFSRTMNGSFNNRTYIKPPVRRHDEYRRTMGSIKLYEKVEFTSQPFNRFANEIEIGQKLCNTVEGLGQYCSASFHSTLLERINQLEKYTEPKIAIVLHAGVRLEYILHTTIHLFRSLGVDKRNIVVMIGRSFTTGHVSENILFLLDSLTIPYRIVPGREYSFSKSINFAKSFSYYKSSWEMALKYFGEEYQYFAFIDEDVEVSSDWLHYLRYASPLLDSDGSLWCVTSSNGVRHKGGDPSRLFRAQRQPGWGYLVTRKTVSEASTEMRHGETSLYDIWLMMNFAKGRECIFPEVGRSIHYGIGENTIPQIHQIYSLEVDVYKGEPIPMTPLSELHKSSYLRKLTDEVRSAEIYLEDPCKADFLTRSSRYGVGPLIFPFHLPYYSDFLEWTLLSECIGLYGHSRPNSPYFVVPISLPKNNSLYIIGVPLSPLSKLVPNVKLWMPNLEDEVTPHFYKLPTFENRTLKSLENSVFKIIT